MSRVAFTIPGEPVGKGRPRAVAEIAWKDGQPEAFVRMVTPKETRQAEKLVRDAFMARHPDHKPWTGAVQINFTAVFETPKSFNRALKEAAARGELYATKKPDKDNIEKLIVDALNGIAWADDAQVMGGGIKRYGSPARIDVSLKSLASPDVPATPGQRRQEKRLQAELDLSAPAPRKSIGTKPESAGILGPRQGAKAPDLTRWSPRQRELIEAALAREQKARQGRK